MNVETHIKADRSPTKEAWQDKKMQRNSKVAPAGGGGEKRKVDGIIEECSVPKTRSSQNRRTSTIASGVNPNSLLFKINLFMEDKLWNYFISGITLYALFFDDIRIMALPKSADTFLGVISLLAMLAFGAELLVFSRCKPAYRWGFYFWLDVLATVTMIPDITFIWEAILNSLTGGSGVNGALDAVQASRVGTKSSRIVRVVRLVRLIRIVKLYKVARGDSGEEDQVTDENPSLVGKKLSDRTMRRVIVVVLTMLIAMPFLQLDLWSKTLTYGQYGLTSLHRHHTQYFSDPVFMGDTASDAYVSWRATLESDIQNYTMYGGGNGDVLYISIQGDNSSMIMDIAKNTKPLQAATFIPEYDMLDDMDTILEQFRNDEIQTAQEGDSISVISVRQDKQYSALLNILQTIFVMVILTYGYMGFSADAEVLVIRPIERMVASVKMLAENPMGASLDDHVVDGEADETVLLQRTIAKIGKLLQIGFGEAGSEIIAKNMASNSGIEPMADGVKMNAVFGFCDIRNFTDTTECLQEKVMVYVNKVGQIVHEATHMYYGAANKNIGDAFLLVWKMGHRKNMNSIVTTNMCDNALVAFLKVIIDLKRENKAGGCLHEYKDYASIRKRFGENNFEIKLGMGLHIGWAIEGTIGSKYKIDASYLSPNVNMAARLEAATKQFRTPLLLSEDFFDGLSDGARKLCRKIDKVTVKGSLQPMGLFTCDIVTYPKTFAEIKFDESGNRIAFDFKSDEMKAISDGLPPNFLSNFKVGIDAYLQGDWDKALTCLNNLLVEKPDDGPTIALLQVMQDQFGNKAPENWPGFRELTEK